MNIANIGVGVYADLNRLHSGLREGQSAVALFAGVAASAFSTVAAAATAAGLVIDDALDGIRISTGATGQALQGLEDSFSRVFANVPNSAADASSAVSQLSVRTGATGVALENLSTQVLTLSRITKSDLNATVTDSAKVFQSWGIAANQQSATLDMVLRASQQTGVGVSTLLQTMVTAGPVFRAAGYDFATSAALIGGFEKAGVNGQRAVASLTAAFRFFAKEGIDAQKGIRDTIARIQELGPGAQASALGVKVFGRSAVDMVAAIQSGRLDVDALANSISTGSETIAAAAKATDGFTETLAVFRNRTVQALEPFGTALLGTFNAGLQAIIAPSRALSAVLAGTARVVIALAVAFSVHLVAGVLAAARAKVAALVASRSLALAHVRETAATLAMARESVNAAVAQVQLARAETAATGSARAETAALANLATAQRAAGIAAAQHAAAQSAVSISARIAAASVTAFRGVLAFFGGPVGLAIAAVLTAISLGFFNAGKRAREAAAQAREAAEEFRAALAGMDEATVQAVGNTQRYNYGVLQRAADAQRANIERQQQIIATLTEQAGTSSGAAEGKGAGAAQISPELRAAQRQLERQQAALAAINRQWTATASNVRAVREQEAALARQRATMPTLPEGPGPLAWEGDDKDGKKWWQQLAEQAQTVRGIFEALRGQQADTTQAGDALASVLQVAQARVAGLGEAVTGELAEARATLLKLISDLQSIDGLGFRVRMDVQGPAQTSAGAANPFITTGGGPAAILRDQQAAAAQAEYWQVERVRQVERANASREELGTLYRFGDLAKQVAEAGQRARELWSSLFDGAPRQVQAFVDAFRVTLDSRAAQVAAGGKVAPVFGSEVITALSGAVNAALRPASGMLSNALSSAAGSALSKVASSVAGAFKSVVSAPLPAAAAFTLAIEALAPVLEALQPAFDALMVPVQMLAEAFGPLLTSLLKAAFPIIKLLMVGLTYLAQVIGYVGGAIFKVVGEVVAAIGDLISRIPGLGQEGQAIERFGRGLVGTSNELFELARSMPGIREEIQALEWADAMNRVADAANRAARAMVNMVEGFKTQAYAFRAAQAERSAPAQAPPAPPVPAAPPTPTPPQRPNVPSGVPRRPNEQTSSAAYQAQLAAVKEEWAGILALVTEVQDREEALVRQRALMQAPQMADPALLSTAWDAFNRITTGAQGRISEMGSAVTDQLSDARGVLRRLSDDLRSVDGLSFAVRAEMPSRERLIAPAPPSTAADDRVRRLPTYSSATTVERSSEQTSVVYQGMSVPVTIHTSGDGPETYREWYNEVQRQARSHPPMRAFAASLAPPA